VLDGSEDHLVKDDLCAEEEEPQEDADVTSHIDAVETGRCVRVEPTPLC